MTPEEQLISLLARATVSPVEWQQVITLVSPTLRWKLISERIAADFVYPLFFRNLEQLCVLGVPEAAHAELHKRVKVNALQATIMVEELTDVLSLLSAEQIPVIPLKGVALAHSLYGDTSLRTCGDIDVLVPPSFAAQAFCILQNKGYESELPTGHFENGSFKSDRIECGLVGHGRGQSQLLELHWGIMWGSSVDEAAVSDLWMEASPKKVFGVPAYTLSPEWEVLFLAGHAARHEWQGLKWLVDIHEVCLRGEFDWQRLANKAKRLGWQRILQLTLTICHRLFNTPVPAELLLTKLPGWIKVFPESSPYRFWRNVLVRLYLLPDWSDRLRFVIRGVLVPTSADHQFLRLPSSLNFMYYPLRLVRLATKRL